MSVLRKNISQLPQATENELKSLKDSCRFIVEYFGGYALYTLLDVAVDTKDPDIRFVPVGNGMEKERLIKRCKNENILNTLFLIPVR